jgi:hypothetical protein
VLKLSTFVSVRFKSCFTREISEFRRFAGHRTGVARITVMAWLQRVSLLLGVLIAAAAATGPAKPALGSFGTAFVAPSLLVGRSSVSPANPSSKAGRLHLAGPLVAPRRASPSRGALTVVCGLKKMFTDFSDNIGEVFKGGAPPL